MSILDIGLDDRRLLPRATPESIDLIRQKAPRELLEMRAWVGADRSSKTLADGTVKSCKAPLCPATGGMAKSNDPNTWSTFEKAAEFALRDERCFGVGVNLLGSEYLGLDLDHVFDKVTGDLVEGASWLLDCLSPTYTEKSPSGDGLRLFLRGKKPAALGTRSQFKDVFGPGTQLEIYDGSSGARYLTVTGNVWVQESIATATDDDLEALVYCAQPPRAEAATTMEDVPILSAPSGTPPPAPRPATASSDIEHDMARARYVLDHVLTDPDAGTHDDWLRIVQALVSLGEPGRVMALEWSKRGRKFDPAKDPGRINSNFSGMVTVATLFKRADEKAPGWRRDYDRATGRTASGRRSRMPTGDDQAPDDAPQYVPLGTRDPGTGRYVLSPSKTMPTANAFLHDHYTHADGLTLRHYAGSLWTWRGNCWREVEEAALQHQLHPWLHEALTYRKNPETKQLELVPFESNPSSVNAALLTAKANTFLEGGTRVPAWIADSDAPYPLTELLPCKTATLHIPTGVTLRPTPRLFTPNALDFDYDAAAPDPVRWVTFLREIFGDDDESILLLQQWFGYVLTADTSQQKILLLIGPKRSGKGTIARVLASLVGIANVCGPTVNSLGGNFGLEPLLGKSLAIIGDARFAGDNLPLVTERLLSISGEDLLSVDRKHKTSIAMTLPVRVMIMTNEYPRLNDASTALAGRFLVLRLTRSFYGNENVNLTNELLAERPGILLWAIQGWHQLRDQGRFTEPESSRAAVREIEDLASPVQAFVRELCVVGPGHRTSTADLFSAWQRWCAADGRTVTPTKSSFGRDLQAAVAGVTRRQGTDGRRFYEGIGLRDGSAS